jgi:carboxyl-terminal processing protease
MHFFKKLGKKTKIALITLSSAVVLFTASSFTDSYFEIAKNLDIFATLFKEVNIYYVDNTKPGELMKKAIDEMLETLDPYTNYIPESQLEDYKYQKTGEYGGIGSLIKKSGEFIMVAEPYEGFAAAKNDLRPGDIILSVDGKSTKGKTVEDMSDALKGSPNSNVTLLIQREGVEKPFEKTMKREVIKIKNVPYYNFVDDNIGYIIVSQFTPLVAKNLQDAFTDLKNKNPNMQGVIVDLRGNPGGFLEEAIKLVNTFVSSNTVIVNTKGKLKENCIQYTTKMNAVDTIMPVAVLVNRGSASASEIVSGSLQDLDRAVVLGQRSFGKGLVQRDVDLSYNSKLKVTISKYYTPSGRCIQALDYTNRNDDGSVGHVPDSLKKEFKTRKGRKVYDGGGIRPDVQIKSRVLSKIALSLDLKGYIFDFANKFRTKNETLPTEAKKFAISNKDYQEFLDFIKDKDYDYSTDSEKELEELMKTIKKEDLDEKVKSEFEALKIKLKHDKSKDLETYKDDIKFLLEQEIIQRYFFQSGKIEHSLAQDKEVIKAVEVLKNKQLYNEILAGKYLEKDWKEY